MFPIKPLPVHPSCEQEGHPIAAPFVASTNGMVAEGLVTSGQWWVFWFPPRLLWGGEVSWCYWLDVKVRLLKCSHVCVCVSVSVCVLGRGSHYYWAGKTFPGPTGMCLLPQEVCLATAGPCWESAFLIQPWLAETRFSALFPGVGRDQAVIVWRFPALIDFPFPGPLARESRLLSILNLFCLCWYAGFFSSKSGIHEAERKPKDVIALMLFSWQFSKTGFFFFLISFST